MRIFLSDQRSLILNPIARQSSAPLVNFPKAVVQKILSLAYAAALQFQFKMADFQLNNVHRSSSIPQAK